MAVKTNFSEADFIEVISNYDLGEFKKFSPISSGAVQTNFILETSKDKFILRYYENRPRESVEFEADLIKFLNSRKYPCPTIFSNKNGNFIGEYRGKPYAVFEFVEGVHLENPNEEQKAELVKKVAELQNLTRDFKSAHTHARWNYSIDLCRELAEKESTRIGTQNSKNKLDWFKNELLNIELPEVLPKGICHCDFHFSNILFKDGKFRALIDFDDANYTYLTYDLATLINPFIDSFEWNTWDKLTSNDNVFDFKESKKMVSEYTKYRELSIEEKKHLFDVVNLSIMLDCVWRFERGEANDFYERRKIDYLNKLGREVFQKELFESLK